MPAPSISIILPTFNHYEDCLKPCLESIWKYTDIENKEVIVVANGCTDNTVRELHKQAPFWRWQHPDGYQEDKLKVIVDSEPLGYTRATNIGILNSSGHYIVFLNNDTVLLPQKVDSWIDMLINPLTSPEVGVTGPLLLQGGHGTGYPFIVFFCAATSRFIINKVGILNETFSPGGCEDVDFCIRVQKKGFKIVAVPPNAIGAFPIFHKGEATMHETEVAKMKYSHNFTKNEQKLIEMYGHR